MNPRPRPRARALLCALARVPGCLALLPGLLLYAAGPSSAAAATPRMRPVPPTGAAAVRASGAVLVPGVSPGDAQVAASANGDFTVSVTNTGTRTAAAVRILLDDAVEGNTVGSSDGRCLDRIDASSPADLWCEVGAVTPGRTVAVDVHAYMRSCVGRGAHADQAAAQDPDAAFTWQVTATDGGRQQRVNGPTPTWSCVPADSAEAVVARTDRSAADPTAAQPRP